MEDMQESRRHKAKLLFPSVLNAGPAINVTTVPNMKDDLRKLENFMHKELKVGWNHATLNTYLEKRMIPRGLLLKKNTTATYPPEFHTEWNDILSKC